MVLYSAEIVGYPKHRPDVRLSSGQIVHSFHPEGECFGDRCPVHLPSDHHLRGLPLAFVAGSMVRILPGLNVSKAGGVLVPDYSDNPVPVVIDPDDYGFISSGSAILRNSGVCAHCGDEIQSLHRHDFKECSCGSNFVDGGTDYLRRTTGLVDTSLTFTATEAEEI